MSDQLLPGDRTASEVLRALRRGDTQPFGDAPLDEVWVVNDLSGTAQQELDRLLAAMGWKLHLPLLGSDDRLYVSRIPSMPAGG